MKQTRAVRLRRLALAALAAGLLAATALTPVMAEPAETGQTGAALPGVDLSGMPEGAPVVEQEEPGEPYALAASVGSYRLYADPASGNFIFSDRRTGRLWSSSPADIREDKLTKGANRTNLRSLLVAHYVELSTIVSSPTPLEVNSSVGSVANGDAAYTPLDNGFRIAYTFAAEGFTIPMEVTLSASGLSVRVCGDDIAYFPGKPVDDGTGEEETSADAGNPSAGTVNSRITAIDVLPGFLAAGIQKQEGYLFVPSGSGALVTFGNNRGQYDGYAEMVYGEDLAIRRDEYEGGTQGIRMPVYGISDAQDTLTAIITKGDASAMILADGIGKSFGYNRVYSRFVTAIVDKTQLFEADYYNQRIIYGAENRQSLGDYTVLFVPTAGEGGGYSGMAAVYRRYLEAVDRLHKAPRAPALAVNLYGAGTRKASFLGVPYTQTFAMTTFAQAQALLEDLRAGGADHVVVRYQGWTGNGMQNKTIPVKAKPVGKLGGKRGLDDLLAYLENTQTENYMDVDFLSIRSSGNGFSVLNNTVKSLFNTRTAQYRYMLSVQVPVLTENPWYLLRPDLLQSASSRMAQAWDGRAGISLAGMGEALYSDFSKKSVTRAQTAAYFTATAGDFADTKVAVSAGNAYMLTAASRIFDLPQTNNGHLLFDRSVPFMQMVLHGYLPYTSEDINRLTDKKEALLTCIETGSDPYFCGMALSAAELIETGFSDLYSSTYEGWSEEAKNLYAAYREVYASLYDQPITGHRVTEEGVAVTTFANGTRIYVNRSGEAQEADGVRIAAESYIVR